MLGSMRLHLLFLLSRVAHVTPLLLPPTHPLRFMQPPSPLPLGRSSSVPPPPLLVLTVSPGTPCWLCWLGCCPSLSSFLWMYVVSTFLWSPPTPPRHIDCTQEACAAGQGSPPPCLLMVLHRRRAILLPPVTFWIHMGITCRWLRLPPLLPLATCG